MSEARPCLCSDRTSPMLSFMSPSDTRRGKVLKQGATSLSTPATGTDRPLTTAPKQISLACCAAVSTLTHAAWNRLVALTLCRLTKSSISLGRTCRGKAMRPLATSSPSGSDRRGKGLASKLRKVEDQNSRAAGPECSKASLKNGANSGAAGSS